MWYKSLHQIPSIWYHVFYQTGAKSKQIGRFYWPPIPRRTLHEDKSKILCCNRPSKATDSTLLLLQRWLSLRSICHSHNLNSGNVYFLLLRLSLSLNQPFWAQVAPKRQQTSPGASFCSVDSLFSQYSLPAPKGIYWTAQIHRLRCRKFVYLLYDYRKS